MEDADPIPTGFNLNNISTSASILSESSLPAFMRSHDGSITSVNVTLHTTTTSAAPEHSMRPLIPKSMMIYIDIYAHIVVPFIVSSFGVVSNVINLIIFSRLGLKDGMSVGLWCLSFSDLTVTGQTLGSSICSLCGLVLPRHTPISPGLVHYVSLLWSQDMMYLVSNWITTFISLERCVCVIRPFKVKAIFTRTRSIIVIFIIFLVHIVSYAPIFASHRLEFTKVGTQQDEISKPGPYLGFSGLASFSQTTDSSFLRSLGHNVSHTDIGEIIAPTPAGESILDTGSLGSLWKGTQTSLPLLESTSPTSIYGVEHSDNPFKSNLTTPGTVDRSSSGGETTVRSIPNTRTSGQVRPEKILVVKFTRNRAVIHHTVDIINGALLPVVQQALVIASAGGLAYGLKAASKVRVGAHAYISASDKGKEDRDPGEAKQAQKSSLSQKEVRLVKVVAFLTLILTICNIPRFIAVYTTLLMPEMHIGEAYENMYVFLWALTALFASVNASVNIFIYLTVNSAYRAVFRQLFWCCSRNDQGKVDDEDRTEGRD